MFLSCREDVYDVGVNCYTAAQIDYCWYNHKAYGLEHRTAAYACVSDWGRVEGFFLDGIYNDSLMRPKAAQQLTSKSQLVFSLELLLYS